MMVSDLLTIVRAIVETTRVAVELEAPALASAASPLSRFFHRRFEL
jgi:hypothetical protein